MQNQAVKNSDKTIVKRRVAHEGDKSRKAVRDLRAGLGSKDTSARATKLHFGADVLLRHAKTQPSSLIAFLIFAAAGAYLAKITISPLVAGIWFGTCLLLVALSLLTAWRYQRVDRQTANLKKWEIGFQFLTFLKGLCWASLLLLHPLFEANGSFSILIFTAIMVITALAFVSARYLKYGVLIAALPMVFMLVIRLAQNGTIASIGMAGMIIALLFFFQFLGKVIREFYIEFLESKAERDQLIMELEAARAISDEARRRAEDANLAKSRFLATMSHELRTPLNAILGFSEIMSNEVMGPLNNNYYKEYVDDIHRSGAHLLKLINEILDLSRVEAGRYDLNEEATSLIHAAEESQQMVKLKAAEKNVTLVMQLQHDLPRIWADARAIRQVILNLLSNALKFTPPGGSIWLKVGWTAGGGQYVSIKDTGPGIPEDEIPIVLSSFGQGSIAIKSAEQGTGLGLPIVQALVHMHDGSFDLKSKLREGTEVIATFPRSRVLEEMPAMPVEGKPKAPHKGGRSFKSQRQKVDAPSMA
ncbi:MAG: HAMP domain-containing sensor histidine kinase [Rhizobiaceae bacterium]